MGSRSGEAVPVKGLPALYLSVDAPLLKKAGGFSSAALGHRPQNRAKGADPRTSNLKGEECFCPGVLSSPCPGLLVPGLSWFRVAGSRALPFRVPVCFCSA